MKTVKVVYLSNKKCPMNTKEFHRNILLALVLLTFPLSYSRAQPDTARIGEMLQRAESLRTTNPDSAIGVATQALNIADGSDSKELLIRVEHTLGNCYYSRNDFELALSHLKRSLQIATEEGIKFWVAMNLNRIGNVYQLKSDYGSALQAYMEALNINRSIDNMSQLARTLVNIGTVYSITGSYKEAIENMLKALETYEQAKDYEGIAWASLSISRLFSRIDLYEKALQYAESSLTHYRQLSNINGITLAKTELANIYYHLGMYSKAKEMVTDVLATNQQNQNIYGQAANHLLLGIINFELGDYTSSKSNLLTSLELKRQVNDSIDMAKLNRYLGEVNLKSGNVAAGLASLEQAMRIAQRQRVLTDQRDIFFSLSQAYRLKGDYRKSLDYFTRYSAVKDSINASQIARMEMQYDFDKREREQELLARQREAIQQAKLERQRMLTLFISIALLLAVALAGVVFYFYRNKKKINALLVAQNQEILRQKEEIETQKEEIESQRDLAERQRDQIAGQQKQITDSIRYASRIQSAVMPRTDTLATYFTDYFVYFQPKNIVSGDFFWVTRLNDGRIAIAVADCTGHGVPGAFMSILGITLLKEIIAYRQVTSAGDLLDKLRQMVIAALNQSGQVQDSHDGMDMGLLVVDAKGMKAEYAGAYMPLLVSRNSNLPEVSDSIQPETANGYSIYEIKGDKMPVGYHLVGERPFTTLRFNILPNDTFYLMSDGYTDQFGGALNQKLMMVNFKKILLGLQTLSLSRQNEELQKQFIEFQGTQKQVDDILVMGFRI